MNVQCPKCGSRHALEQYGKGIARKRDPKWYEPSNEYATRECPACGAELRLNRSTKIQMAVVLVAGCTAAVLAFFVVYGWLLLGACLIAVATLRKHVQLEPIEG